MSVVALRHLSKRHGRDVVVRDLDLDIADGEFLVIVGPSGCGKTSVLRMVAGLDPVSGGEVLVDGLPVTATSHSTASMGMIFQEPALYPHMSVAQNIGFPLKIEGHHRRTVRREVAAIAELLGLSSLLRSRPRELSGGQRQRVAMARALIRRPGLLLMDEPMSNLDAKLRTELRSTIARLRHELGVTTLYVTHDQVEALALGDRIAVMRHGELVQLGTPQDVYHRPADAFVATFIGLPTMNLFLATLRDHGGEPHLDTGATVLALDRARPGLLGRYRDRTVIAGIRPQAFRFTGDGAVVDVERIDLIADRVEVQATLSARRVDVTDRGVEIGGRPTPLVIDAAADAGVDLELWRPSHLVVDPDDIHLFDPSSGRSLRPNPSLADAVN